MSSNLVKLGQVATFINGKAFKPNEWTQSGIPIIRIQNLTNNAKEFNYYQGKLEPRYLVKKGDILISWSASLGVFEWDGPDAALNQHIFKVEFNKLDVEKVYFKFIVSQVIDEMLRFVHGSTMKHIVKNDFDNTKIPLPKLSDQQRIANILDHADSIRHKNRQVLKKYGDLAQSVFYEMFGNPIKNSFNYQIITLKEACYSIKDGPHISPKYVEKGIPFISVNNIIKGVWDFSNLKFISQADHELFSKKCNPRKGDILYSKGGTTGFAKYIDIDLEFSNWVHLAVLKFDREKINGRFLESMLNSPYCYRQSQLLTRGIANRDLVLGQMGKIKILYPPIELQNKFSNIIENIETQKVNVKQSLEKSERLYQSLLQRAFKGEL